MTADIVSACGDMPAFRRRSARSGPRELVEGLILEVQGFAAGAPQADDLTVMALRHLG
jgi:serine phosphatase RsbU (regulator of sigma subunit)